MKDSPISEVSTKKCLQRFSKRGRRRVICDQVKPRFKSMPATVVSITEDLWKNARDSIFHALEHFLELSLGEGEKFHHTKWIVLSVHHLAETFCGMLLKEFDPTNAI